MASAFAIFAEGRCEAARELAKLGARHGELRAQERQAAEKVKAAGEELDAARAASRVSEGRQLGLGGLAGEVKQARARVARAEKLLPLVEQEHDQLRAAIEAVEAEARRIGAAKGAELRAELAADAEAAAARLRAALVEAQAAREEWRQQYSRVSSWLGATEPDTLRSSRLPTLPPDVDALARRAAALADAVEPPLPVVSNSSPPAVVAGYEPARVMAA